MYSQTFTGREIFSSIWGLVVLSATADEITDLQFPFDLQLRRFATRHETELFTLWQSIQKCTCLNDDVMKIAVEESPWTGISMRYEDLDALKAELVLASSKPEQFRGVAEFQRLTINSESIHQACTDHLVRLLDALLSAHWAFCVDAQFRTETWADFTQALQDVFLRLVPIVENARLHTNSLFTVAYLNWVPAWRETAIHPDADAYRIYAEGWIEHMRAYLK